MSMKTTLVADNGIEFRLVGDCYIPNLMLPEENRSIGFWGRLHRDYLKEQFCDQEELTIHNVVINRYLPSAAQKTIVFQAAVSWTEDHQIQQKRFDICYAYLLGQEYSTIAANCPNCGGAIGYGISVCPYCDSRVANVLGNTWYFTEITET